MHRPVLAAIIFDILFILSNHLPSTGGNTERMERGYSVRCTVNSEPDPGALRSVRR